MSALPTSQAAVHHGVKRSAPQTPTQAPPRTGSPPHKHRRLDDPPPGSETDTGLNKSLLQVPQVTEWDLSLLSLLQLQLIGNVLLPDQRRLDEEPHADARQTLLNRGAITCQRAARVSSLWRHAMLDVLRRLGHTVLRTTLPLQPSQQWEGSVVLDPVALDVTHAPEVFASALQDSHVAQRVEALMLKMAHRPWVFIRMLRIVLRQARELAAETALPDDQRQRLLNLPCTALALLYTRGLLHEPDLFPAIAELMLEQLPELDQRLGRTLLLDLKAILNTHCIGPLGGLRQRVLQALKARTRPPSANANANQTAPISISLDKKKEMANDHILRDNALIGPSGIRLLRWMAKNGTEPEIEAMVKDLLFNVLADAAQGLGPNDVFRGAFLFEMFPVPVLTAAFNLVEPARQARLLQVEHATPAVQRLMLEFLGHSDATDAERAELIARLHWRPDT